MKGLPELSIGIPVYNGAQYLPLALDSILAQTYRNFEVVISDNASTDNTEAVCRAYAQRDKRILYFRQKENTGAAQNFSRTFQLSSGRFFKWAAADDVCLPAYFEQCVKELTQNDSAVLCYARTKIIDGAGTFVKDYDDGIHLDSHSACLRFRELLNRLGECNAVFGIIRSDVLARTRLIGNYIGSDICLLLELSLYGRFLELPQRLFLRRDHPGSSSADKSNGNQLQFFDPKRKGELTFPFWRRYAENLSTILRTPISWEQKRQLLRILAMNFVQSRKHLVRDIQIGFKSRSGSAIRAS